METTHPITQQEAYELIEPIYKVIGGGVAVIVLLFAIFLIIYPFTNRRIR